MTAYAIITGALFRAPEARTSKAGKPFVRQPSASKTATPRNGGA